MSKMITLTDESIAEIKEEFARALMGAIPDGKINFQKTIGTVQRKAELAFKEIAWYKMQSLIKTCDKEVGWHGIAKRGDNPEKDEYIIEDILVYPQEVTGTTVTPDQVQYQMWLMSHDDDVFNNIRMQGHSHVNMGTSPSSVDTAFYDQILRQLDDTMFYIFMIWNKRGDHTIKIYDMAKNVLFENADVTVTILEDDTGIEHFISEAKKMVTDRKYTPATATPAKTGTYGGYGGNQYGGYGGNNMYGNNSPAQAPQYYQNSQPSSVPASQPVSPAPVVASTPATTDAKKKSGKKHRVNGGKKSQESPARFFGYSSCDSQIYTGDLEDDDPYGPYGFRDEYYGFDE